MAIVTYPISQMPGNEQKEFWGSANAETPGSYNLIGIKDSVIDELINGLVAAQSKDDYAAHVMALDRLLRHGHYIIMQWYSPYHRIAYRDKFAFPENKLNLGFMPAVWWLKGAENNAQLHH